MSAQSDVDRYRREVTALQKKIADQSKKVAEARGKEARHRQSASTASSPTAAKSRLRDAERESKNAIDAEKQRASLEGQLATKQKSLFDAEAKLSKERAAQQTRSMRELEQRSRSADARFRPSVSALAGIAQPESAEHDMFISHASEDKGEVARPLAEALRDRGLRVWYDEFVLEIGDKLRRTIDRGLAGSRFGVIVLSPDFFRKEWPQAELDGLAAKERSSGEKVILPIWHRLTRNEVLGYSPMLAEVLALNTAVMTIDEMADAIAGVVRGK